MSVHAATSSSVDGPRAVDHIATRLATAGTAVSRYGLVFLLLLWGAAKFTLEEATGIRPLVEHSPLVSWMYPAFGLRGASAVFGVFEIGVGLGVASRRWLPRVSSTASLAAAAMFVVTLSFLLTTPDAFAPSSPWGGFLMKDLILLGAALSTAAEARRHEPER